MIAGVNMVVVHVEDEERAKEFWTKQIGFDLTTDASYGDGQRWIEVTPPDGQVALVLSRRNPNEPRRDVSPELPHSPVFFKCVDIEKTYRELAERGVRFPAAPVKMSFGWWAMFEDESGTRYALTQK